MLQCATVLHRNSAATNSVELNTAQADHHQYCKVVFFAGSLSLASVAVARDVTPGAHVWWRPRRGSSRHEPNRTARARAASSR
jgi:hypothetical protein